MLKYFSFTTLTRKFTAFLFVMSLAPIILLGFISYQTSSKTLIALELSHSKDIIAAQEKILDVIFREIEGLIHNISGVEDLVDAMDKNRNELSTFEQLSAQAKIGYILNGYLGLEGLVSIDVISEKGGHFYVGQTLAKSGINVTLLEELKSSADASRSRIILAGVTTPINLSTKQKHVLTAAKVIRKADLTTNTSRLVGVIVISYDLNSIHDTLSATNAQQLGSSMLLDQNNNLIYQKMNST